MLALYDFVSFLFGRLFYKSESLPVVGFCPHVNITGVFGNACPHFIQRLGPI